MTGAPAVANSTDFNVRAVRVGGPKSNTCGARVLLLHPGTRERRGGASPPWAPPRWLSGHSAGRGVGTGPSPAAVKRAKRNARRNLLAACALMSSQLLAGAQHLRAYSIRYAANSPRSIGLSTCLEARPGTCPPVVHVERVPPPGRKIAGVGASVRGCELLYAETRRRSRSRTAAAVQPPVPASRGRRPVA